MTARPELVDAGIAFIRNEVMPALQELPGSIGVSLLADRQSGRCIATSAWESEDAMYYSTDETSRYRQQVAEQFGGSPTSAEWEIAVLHREHSSDNGACVRATWLTVPPDLIDGGIEYFRGSVLPQVEQLPGFCSASLLVSRGSGRAVSSVSFRSREMMRDNRDYARALKVTAMQAAGATEIDDHEFDLAIAHLRVPELV
jgi:heme-degrading monooxygenase HmoA